MQRMGARLSTSLSREMESQADEIIPVISQNNVLTICNKLEIIFSYRQVTAAVTIYAWTFMLPALFCPQCYPQDREPGVT